MNNTLRTEICVCCSGTGRFALNLLMTNSQAGICPICRGSGKVSGLDPYLTRDGYLSIEIANHLKMSHGLVKEIDLLDIGNDQLISVELFFEDGTHYKLGGFAVGYSGTRPDLFVKLVNNAGFHITADDVLKMHSPGFYITEDQSNEIILISGLLWQAKCDGIKRTFEEAQNYCSQLNLAGLQHWRLPALEEYQRLGLQLETEYSDFWTATLEPELADNIAYIDDGTTMFLTNQYYARGVHEISVPITRILESEQFQSKGEVPTSSPSPVLNVVKMPEPVHQEPVKPEETQPAEIHNEIVSSRENVQKDQDIPVVASNLNTQIGSIESKQSQHQQEYETLEIPHIPPPTPIQPKMNPVKKKHAKELSGVGYFLAILITVVLTIILTLVFVPSLPQKIAGNQGDVIDLAGYLGSITGMSCGIATLVGPVTYTIIKTLFPKKNNIIQQEIQESGKATQEVPSPAAVKNPPLPKKEKVRIAVLSLIVLIGVAVGIIAISRYFNANSSAASQFGGMNTNGSAEVVSGCVSASSLRIRTGPGTEYSVVKGLSSGECVMFDGRDPSGSWIRLSPEYSDENDQRFWVSSDYIVLEEDISKLPVVTVP